MIKALIILITTKTILPTNLCNLCKLKTYDVGPKYTVCASNGKTYKNGCFAWCNKSKVLHPGVCNVNHNPCDCPDKKSDYKPVCTFDGESYDSECVAKCYGKDVAASDFCFLNRILENKGNNHFPESGPHRIRFRKNEEKYLKGMFVNGVYKGKDKGRDKAKIREVREELSRRGVLR